MRNAVELAATQTGESTETRSMIRTIVVPTDGSQPAAKAVEMAGEMAAVCKARLVILHVVSPDADVPEGLRQHAEMRMPPDKRDPREIMDTTSLLLSPETLVTAVEKAIPAAPVDMETRHFIGRMILEGAERAAREKGAEEVTAICEEGDPARGILDVAERQKADLIVIGRRGLGDLKGLLVGSVSNKILHHADCSCVVVK